MAGLPVSEAVATRSGTNPNHGSVHSCPLAQPAKPVRLFARSGVGVPDVYRMPLMSSIGRLVGDQPLPLPAVMKAYVLSPAGRLHGFCDILLISVRLEF